MFSTKHCLEKYNKNDRSPFSFKRMWWANLTSFVPVLVLITRVIHRSKLHFAVAQNFLYKSNTQEKTWQVESVAHIEQFRFIQLTRASWCRLRARVQQKTLSSLKEARNSFHFPQTSFTNPFQDTVRFVVSLWNLPQK